MDLAIYINELLGLKGEVNVPGVGFFAQKRVNGYYSESDAKFYPPKHEIIFDPAPRDDDGLAEYISQKKNISPASAKYFIEKYATGLKQEASSQSAAITGLGHLFYEYSTLTFRADIDAGKNDPAFYGMEPVKVYKKPEKSELKEEAPEEKKPEPKPEPVKEEAIEAEEFTPLFDPPSPVYEEEVEEEVEEEPRRSRGGVWVIVLLVVIIGLLCFGVAYQYKPEWFGKHRPVDTMIIVNGPPPVAAKPDSAKAAKVDSTVKVKAAPTTQNSTPGLNIDSAVSHWEVFLSAVKGKTAAEKEIANYKAAGIPAFISPDAKGKMLIKIIAGSYASVEEAEKARKDLIKTGKVPKNIYSLEIKPKKQK